MDIRILIISLIFILCFSPSAIAIEDITLEETEKKKRQVQRDSINTEEDILKGGIFTNVRPVGGFVFGYSGINNSTADNQVSMPITEVGILADLPGGWTLHNTYNWSYFFRNKGHFWLNGFVYKNLDNDTKVMLGRYRLPIGHDGALSPYKLEFASRSIMGRTISNTRDFGARIISNKKYAKVDLNVSNGSQERRLNVDGNVDFTGWVDFKPLADYEDLGEMVIGTGLRAGKYQFAYTTYGAYASYKYKRLKVEGEYAYSDGYNSLSFSENIVDSHYYSAYYDITQKLKFLARHDTFDPNKYVLGDDIKEHAIGFLYTPKKDNLCFYLNYVVSDNPAKEQSQKFVFVTQITPF